MGALSYALLTLGLAAVEFRVAPQGRFIPGQLGHGEYPVAPVTITAKLAGEPTEDDWCAWVEVEWPGGTRSTEKQDCPPWDDWVAQVGAERDCRGLTVTPDGEEPDCPRAFESRRLWQWTRVFPARGEWHVRVNLYVGAKKVRSDVARFTVVGSE